MYGDLRDILEKLVEGKISVEEAARLIRLFAIENIDKEAKFDLGRKLRRGVPEIIYGEGKNPDLLVNLVKRVVNKTGRVIISRLTTEQFKLLKKTLGKEFNISMNMAGRIAVVRRDGFKVSVLPCKVGIVTAGTADIAVAEEAKVIVEEMGCETVTIYDAGIAGLHRSIEAAKRLKEEDVDVVIVVAGMEGALPSLIASLLDVPVIGVPTSIGYGIGGKGIAAIFSMLQACPLGLSIVNIDNGVGAGVIAALIAKRVGIYRAKSRKHTKKLV